MGNVPGSISPRTAPSLEEIERARQRIKGLVVRTPLVRLDSENWMKCGTEFFDGRRHASVVFTRDFSDWSTMPDLSDTAPIWWRAVRKKDSIETLCSLDGKSFVSVRQGYFAPGGKVDVGIMCAAPEGPGFEAVFDGFKLEVG